MRPRLQVGAASTQGTCREANGDVVFVSDALAVYAVLDGRASNDEAVTLAFTQLSAAAESGEPIERALYRADGAIREKFRAHCAEVTRKRLTVRAKFNRAIHWVFQRSLVRELEYPTCDYVQVSSISFDALRRSATVTHIGGSSVYRLRDTLEAITEQVSMVNVHAHGEAAFPEECLQSLRRGIFRRGLGAESEQVIDVRSVDVHPGDVYLLCTDGVPAGTLLGSSDCADLLRSESNSARAARKVLDLADAHLDGSDDATALVIRVEP